MNNELYLISKVVLGIILLGICAIFLKSIVSYLNYKKRQSYVDKHIHYTAILNFYMEKAFELIYKDRMLIYSIEGTKPSENDIKQNSIDFTKLGLKLLGPTLIKEFVFLYGNEETLYFVMAEYFNTRSEHDDIKQDSINQIMEGSDNEII